MKALCRSILVIPAAAWFATAAFAAGHTYKIEVAGLACPFCAYGIEKKLDTIDGVQHLETNIEAGTVTVTMKDGATLEKAAAAKAVKDAGFTLNGFTEIAPVNAH